ncbi:MAG: class I SAM-dependent methyltransferase [Deltaproteobacteria bacterium]|nr:class I SAM-dependent methyltransferase [Deltaproteobacteria bacterium]
MAKLYPGSQVEVSGFVARHYDLWMDLMSFGRYDAFIRSAVRNLDIEPGHHILDLGAGTGRNTKLMAEYLEGRGKITAFEIGKDMTDRFHARCGQTREIELLEKRIDQPFKIDPPADKAFISFVIHGLPHPNRLEVLKNVHNNLKPSGLFHILDFSKELVNKNFAVKLIFRTLECPYAWDYVNRDWDEIFPEFGFEKVSERPYFMNTITLLSLKKKA